MKILVSQIDQIFHGAHAIGKANSVLPSRYFHRMGRNLRIIIPEYNQLNAMDEDTKNEIWNDEIELPLSKISVDDLPENMPNNIETSIGKVNAMMLIRPLLDEDTPEKHESVLAKLIENKNGKETETKTE